MKKLILFSGGLDSTFLYQQHAGKADLLYVDVINNAVKADREKAAIQKIRSYINKQVVGSYDDKLMMTHPRFMDARNVRRGEYQQMGTWFSALFEYANPHQYDEAMVGYLLTDDSARSMSELVKAWDHLWMACRPDTYDKRTRLVFPLGSTKKGTIMAEMDQDLQRLTTSCESPTEGDHCGICVPCQTKFSTALHMGLTHLLTDNEVIAGMARQGYADIVKRHQSLQEQE